jgi:hypothetical protein
MRIVNGVPRPLWSRSRPPASDVHVAHLRRCLSSPSDDRNITGACCFGIDRYRFGAIPALETDTSRASKDA